MSSLLLLAVYGTLKKGLSNHYPYLKNAIFLGKGKTRNPYKMVVKGGIPFVFSTSTDTGLKINVEVYKIDLLTLITIDTLEEHPTWYVRKQIPISLESKKIETAWMYFNDTVIDTGVYYDNFNE
ncbi:MAG: gamma-glutamylcyclotransferase family protein [Flavobacteriaceae bacterium]